MLRPRCIGTLLAAPEEAREVTRRLGATRIAVVRAIGDTSDPEEAARDLRAALRSE